MRGRISPAGPSRPGAAARSLIQGRTKPGTAAGAGGSHRHPPHPFPRPGRSPGPSRGLLQHGTPAPPAPVPGRAGPCPRPRASAPSGLPGLRSAAAGRPRGAAGRALPGAVPPAAGRSHGPRLPRSIPGPSGPLTPCRLPRAPVPPSPLPQPRAGRCSGSPQSRGAAGAVPAAVGAAGAARHPRGGRRFLPGSGGGGHPSCPWHRAGTDRRTAGTGGHGKHPRVPRPLQAPDGSVAILWAGCGGAQRGDGVGVPVKHRDPPRWGLCLPGAHGGGDE